jgi:hypothetical protein
MSDNTPTEPFIQRWLKSPFNGELWPVHPELTVEQYDYMVKVGFVPVDKPPAKAKPSGRSH